MAIASRELAGCQGVHSNSCTHSYVEQGSEVRRDPMAPLKLGSGAHRFLKSRVLPVPVEEARKGNARRSLSSIRKKLDLLLNNQIVRNCMIILDASAGEIRSKCLSHGATTSKFTQDLNIYGEQMNQNGRESPRTMIFYVHALLLSIL